MNVGFVFLVLALGSAAISAGVYYAPPANMHFGVLIVLYLAGWVAALGFGFLAVLSFAMGSFS